MLRLMLSLAFALAITPLVAATETKEAEALGRHFTEARVKGTFVLYDVAADVLHVYNPQRAETRFVPASTFKIPNSLIGLETGAVSSVDEVLPYGGKPQRLPQWEKDMGLREAIIISNVPIYQELARRIGAKQMAPMLEKLDYGNKEIGSQIDQFWLEGPLKISAIEQARFLAKLATDTLPLKPAVLQAVKEITLVEKDDAHQLHAKTGWGVPKGQPQIGWWVGWVEKEGKIYTFAMNIEIVDDSDAPKRLAIARACLKELGAL